MKNKTTRLRFEEEELANKPVARAAKKAERAADKADAAKARLPTKNKLKHEKDTLYSVQKAGNGSRDCFGRTAATALYLLKSEFSIFYGCEEFIHYEKAHEEGALESV